MESIKLILNSLILNILTIKLSDLGVVWDFVGDGVRIYSSNIPKIQPGLLKFLKIMLYQRLHQQRLHHFKFVEVDVDVGSEGEDVVKNVNIYTWSLRQLTYINLQLPFLIQQFRLKSQQFSVRSR